jgi:hypothetical protein
MYKYLKNLEQYANLSSRGAMEAGDHFKNGASPRTRKKFLLLYFAWAKNVIMLCGFPKELFMNIFY